MGRSGLFGRGCVRLNVPSRNIVPSVITTTEQPATPAHHPALTAPRAPALHRQRAGREQSVVYAAYAIGSTLIDR